MNAPRETLTIRKRLQKLTSLALPLEKTENSKYNANGAPEIGE